MSDEPANLDDHRGMMAQKATELRRLTAEVMADQTALRARRDALEERLASEPAANWHEAIEKVRYLLMLFAETPAAEDPRRRKLLDDVLADLDRLDAQTH